MAAIRVSELLAPGQPARQLALAAALGRLDAGASAEVQFQAALSAGNLPKPDALPLLARIATQQSEQLLIREAVVSGLENFELQFLQLLLADPQWGESRAGRPALLHALASAVVKEREPAKVAALHALAADQPPAQAWRQRALRDGIAAGTRTQPARPATTARALTPGEQTSVAAGKNIFEQLCFACHGLTGQGTVPMGPPLVNSEWVLGAESRLIRIVLHGMAGPLKVNGTTYQPPNILPEMPALANLDDASVAAVLSYVRRAWGHEAAPISPAQVATVRAETQEKKSSWTEAQLLEIK